MDMQQLRGFRETIDGELNRMMVSDDESEVKSLGKFLRNNIEKYISENEKRVRGEMKREQLKGGGMVL